MTSFANTTRPTAEAMPFTSTYRRARIPLIEFREGEQQVKGVSKRRMRWQTTVPVLALILVLAP